MKRMVMVGMVALVLALSPEGVFARGKSVVVRGVGTAILTDPGLNLEGPLALNPAAPGGEYPLAFDIAGVIRANGTASGTAEFVYSRPFSQVFDADLIVLTFNITGGFVNPNGTVTLTGTSYERDYALGVGLFFEEVSDFEIVILEDGVFTIRWCHFDAPFEIEVTRGWLAVR